MEYLATTQLAKSIAVGEKVKRVAVGDRVAPIVDTENITGKEPTRSWLAADEDGVLADYLVFDEEKLCKLPAYLDWIEASTVPCAGLTAWAALKDVGIGKSVLIQGKIQIPLAEQFAKATTPKVLAASACLPSSLLERLV